MKKGLLVLLFICLLCPVLLVRAESTTYELRTENGEKYLYANGEKDTSFTDLYHNKSDNAWYYIVKGRWEKNYNGVVLYSVNKKYYYISKGLIDRTYSGLFQDTHTNTWWYLEKGIVNMSYEGLVLYEPNGKLYYIKDGKIDRTYNGTVYYETTDKTYNVVNGVATATVEEMKPLLSVDRSQTLKGIDISNYQNDLDLAAIDCDFVILKATEGAGVTDASFYRNFARAQSLGKKVGFYHFARPINTPYEDAEYFYEHTKQYFHQGIPVLDWEAEHMWDVGWAKTWLDYIYSRTGVKPLIYMSQSTANDYDWSSVVNAGYKLWIARYNNTYANYNYDLSAAGPAPYSKYWPNYTMWQYTDQGRLNGYRLKLDLNVFYGTKDYWDQLAGKQIVRSLSEPYVYAYDQYQNNTLLTKPKLVAVYNSAYGADIRWKPQDGVEEYLLMRKENGVWSSVAVLPVSSLKTENGNYKYIDMTVKDRYGKGYIYSVAAKRGESVSAYDTKGLAFYRLQAPKITSAYAVGRDAVEVRWSEEKCQGYELQYSPDEGKTWIKCAQTDRTAKTVSGLIPGTKYVFRVRCQKTNKDRGTTWSPYSAWRSAWAE